MASELRVDQLRDTAGNNLTPLADLSQGRAKAWVCFQGTGTVTILDSFNVASITDVGTGRWTVNFANALSNANYAVSYSHTRFVGGFSTSNASRMTCIVGQRTNGFDMNHATTTPAYDDAERLAATVFGD